MNSKLIPIFAIFLLVGLASCGLHGEEARKEVKAPEIPFNEPKLNATCSIDSQCKAHNTVCRANKCQCSLGYLEYHKSICRQAYCENNEFCVQLFGPNTVCGPKGKCACSVGAKVDHDSQKCLLVASSNRVQRKIFPKKLAKPTINKCKFGQLPAKSEKGDCIKMNCLDNFDCQYIFGSNATCGFLNTCLCDRTHLLDEATQTCSIVREVKKNNLNQFCTDDSNCGPHYSECRANTCQCQLGFETRGNTCRPVFCSTNEPCRKRFGPNTKCSWNGDMCTCDDSFMFDPIAKQCVPDKRALNSMCFSDTECGHGAVCTDQNTCKCKLGYVQDGQSQYNCRQMSCFSDAECNAHFKGSSCEFGNCACTYEGGYKLKSSNQSCVPRSKRIGDSCVFDSDCGNSASCVFSQCRCWSGNAPKTNQMDCKTATCSYNSDCELLDMNSQCYFGSCSCKDGYSTDYMMQKCSSDFTYDYSWNASVSVFAMFSLLSICLGIIIITLRHRRATAASTNAYVTSSAKVSFPQKS